jgi:hypothetical protein
MKKSSESLVRKVIVLFVLAQAMLLWGVKLPYQTEYPLWSVHENTNSIPYLIGPACAVAGSAPDLTVTGMSSDAVITDGQTLTVAGVLEVQVRNIGAADVTVPFTLTAFEDQNANGTFEVGADIVLGAVVHGTGLPAGNVLDLSVGLSGTVRFKGNIIYAFVDSNNAVAEADETNNISHTGLSSVFIPPVGPFNPVLEWSWTSSAVEPNSLNVMMTPSVIDLNGDAVPDVVFASTASTGGALVEVGVLRALNGRDGSELFTVTDPALRVNTASSIATGDIDLDGSPEIVACDSTGARLIAFEHDGTFKWRSVSLEAINWGAPSIADLDGDGTPEIVIGRQVLDNNGVLKWTGTGGRGSQANVGPLSLVADVNLDGRPEVVAGNTLYSATGATLWHQPGLPDGYNAVANFDGDDFPEIVLVSGGRVWLLEHDGRVAWGPVSIPGGGAGGPPTVADYDNDGMPEIGVAGAARYAVFETNGSLKWAQPTQDVSSNRTGSSVFDFEGDGSAEVVYRDELFLRVYRGKDGTVIFQAPMSSCTWHEYVLVADVDADGNAEIVAVANNNCGYGSQRGVYVFGDVHDNWVATRQIWNQHTYHITNVNSDGTIPAVEQNNWLVKGLNNYRLNEFLPGEGRATAAPDLVPSFVRVDQANCPTSVDITARVGNGGALFAPAGVLVSFYLGDPAAGGILTGTVPTSTLLRPGDFNDVTVVWHNPIIGQQEIFVAADDDGSGHGLINEGNEDNNKYKATVPICVSLSCVDDLKARAKSGKVQLVWTDIGAHHYNVYRSTTAGGPYLFIGTTTSRYSTYLDTTVINGTTFYYVVREAVLSGYELCQSNEARATPTAIR